jgi:hypothetical protein
LEALVPILVRPVREQLEHDRIIRLLEAKWRRKFKVDANPGEERNAGVKVPAGTLYPDLVLTEEGGRKPKALIEVETNESVNHLEAMAQWANLAKARTSLVLFVPVGAVEAARRLSAENSIKLTELWTYMVLGDQVRFTSVYREHGAEPADLIEKVEMFTTERSAPAPRPVPVEPVEPAAAPVAEPERPRKLAVKAGSRPSGVDGTVAKVAAALEKVVAKAATVVAKAANKVVPRPGPSKAVAPEPPPAPAKAPVTKPAAPKAEVVVKAAPKPAVAMAPVKAAAPPKPAPAGKTAVPAKPVVSKPAEKVVAKPMEKAGSRFPIRPAEKVVAKKTVGKPEVQKAVGKTAAAKPAGLAKKPAPKPAPRPVARKAAAAPVRPPVRPASVKKAAPAAAAKSRPSSKRK